MTRYAVIGHPEPNRSMVVVVPGFSGGLVAFYRFAHILNKESRRQVIILDQPRPHSLLTQWRRGRLTSKLSALDHQSEALLAVLDDAGLTHQPVDFIAHSFGAMVLWRASELAKRRHITSFNYQNGSHSIFLAPSGTYAYEDLTNLSRRFLRHKRRPSAAESAPLNKLIDEAARKSLLRNPLKHLKEIFTLSRRRIPYAKLPAAGLQPMIFSFSGDAVFPHEILAGTLEKHRSHIYGYAMISAPDARHDDPIYHPRRTIHALLPELSRPPSGGRR